MSNTKTKEPVAQIIISGRFKNEIFARDCSIKIFNKKGNPILKDKKDSLKSIALLNSNKIEGYKESDGPFVYGFVNANPYIVSESQLSDPKKEDKRSIEEKGGVEKDGKRTHKTADGKKIALKK